MNFSTNIVLTQILEVHSIIHTNTAYKQFRPKSLILTANIPHLTDYLLTKPLIILPATILFHSPPLFHLLTYYLDLCSFV